jgi:hypothetical protein
LGLVSAGGVVFRFFFVFLAGLAAGVLGFLVVAFLAEAVFFVVLVDFVLVFVLVFALVVFDVDFGLEAFSVMIATES